MVRYEYRVISVGWGEAMPENTEHALNSLGAAGYRLVSVTNWTHPGGQTASVDYVFMLEIQQ